MPERHRSKDGSRDTEQFEQTGGGGDASRYGGNLARKVGTRDEIKAGDEDAASATRVRKSEEKTRADKKNSSS